MHNQRHPDTELLDRLRAGLLDDRLEEKAAIEQHLHECETCRSQMDIWSQLDADALGPLVDSSHIGSALRAARQQALSANRRRRHTLLPYATAAALVLAVAVGLWTTRPGIDTNNMVADTTAVPDIYEDLDFYLWLATQDESEADNGST